MSTTDKSNNGHEQQKSRLTSEMIAALLDGQSDAKRMQACMAVATSAGKGLEDRISALEDFKDLIEQIDNANDIEPLQLWKSLLSLLKSDEAQLRAMAASCIGTAVQNNIEAQKKLLEYDGIQPIARMAVDDPDEGTRNKAISALRSATKNFQDGLNNAIKYIPASYLPGGRKPDAAVMEDIDRLVDNLKGRNATEL